MTCCCRHASSAAVRLRLMCRCWLVSSCLLGLFMPVPHPRYLCLLHKALEHRTARLQGFSVLSSDLDITLFRNPLSPQV